MTLPHPRLCALAGALLTRSTAGEVITTARAGRAGIGAHFWPQVRRWLITTGRLDAAGCVPLLTDHPCAGCPRAAEGPGCTHWALVCLEAEEEEAPEPMLRGMSPAEMAGVHALGREVRAFLGSGGDPRECVGWDGGTP